MVKRVLPEDEDGCPDTRQNCSRIHAEQRGREEFYPARCAATWSGDCCIFQSFISQNDKKDTAAFDIEFGITFPLLLDDTRTYPVSNAYGLTTVPTIFWIEPDGEIEISSVGWVRSDFERINQRMAERTQGAQMAIFRPGEEVRDFRAG